MESVLRKKHYLRVLRKIKSHFPKYKIDAFITTFLPHIKYLSGFSGSNAICIITERNNYLITDKRYLQQAQNETFGWEIVESDSDVLRTIIGKKILQKSYRIGIDGNHTAYTKYLEMKSIFNESKILPISELIEDCASVKEPYEIECIKTAVDISSKVFEKILDLIKPDIRELEISAEISYLQKVFGAEGDAFPPIVASGKNSAYPHSHSTKKKLKYGEMITLDFGCVYKGYHSDMTRTVFLGKPDERLKKLYGIVLEAQNKGIETAYAGVKCKDLDFVARDFINKLGFGKYFTHSLGHGIGLSIHEAPHISYRSSEVLQKGNVITIEPGIYMQNIGGVRIEDVLLITDNKPKILTKASKELIIL